jgi:hypothetical protein
MVKKKLLDQVTEVARFRHLSLCTEAAYRNWIKRFAKLLYLALRNIAKKWTRYAVPDWPAALNRFGIIYEGRLTGRLTRRPTSVAHGSQTGLWKPWKNITPFFHRSHSPLLRTKGNFNPAVYTKYLTLPS